MRLVLLLTVLLLAACGGGDDAGGGVQPGAGDDALTGSDRPANDLVVEQDLGDGSPPQRWTLVCAGQVEGDHPDAEAACAHLDGLDDPFAPLPADQLCTEIYGGPQTARVTGVWAATPVDLALSRTDGCRIAQWDSLGPLLPGPVGAEGPDDAPQ
jgi:hypothetical protein